MRVEFFVHGQPQPQGSTRAFMAQGAQFPSVTTDNKKLKPWRQDVAGLALGQMLAQSLPGAVDDPMRVQCEFAFRRPKSTSRKIKHKLTKPDIDKLARGVLDALTGIVFCDDSQVVALICIKVFAEIEGTHIVVESVA